MAKTPVGERGNGYRESAQRAITNRGATRPRPRNQTLRKHKSSALRSRVRTRNANFNAFLNRLAAEEKRENEQFRKNFPTNANFMRYFEKEMKMLE